jgi:hypothetical protein
MMNNNVIQQPANDLVGFMSLSSFWYDLLVLTILFCS